MERELVKIASNDPAFNGYYTQFKDCMKPGDVVYIKLLSEGNPPVLPEKKRSVIKRKNQNDRTRNG